MWLSELRNQLTRSRERRCVPKRHEVRNDYSRIGDSVGEELIKTLTGVGGGALVRSTIMMLAPSQRKSRGSSLCVDAQRLSLLEHFFAPVIDHRLRHARVTCRLAPTAEYGGLHLIVDFTGGLS